MAQKTKIESIEGYDDTQVRIVDIKVDGKQERVLATYLDEELAAELDMYKGWVFTFLDEREVPEEVGRVLIEEMRGCSFTR